MMTSFRPAGAALAGACALLLCGCSFTRTYVDPANLKVVPEERVLRFQKSVDPENEAVVRIVRVANFASSGCFTAFFIDDLPVARLDPEEMAVLHVPAGRHLLRHSRDWLGRGLCTQPNGLDDSLAHGKRVFADLKPGRLYTFRLGVGDYSFRLFKDPEGVALTPDVDLYRIDNQ